MLLAAFVALAAVFLMGVAGAAGENFTVSYPMSHPAEPPPEYIEPWSTHPSVKGINLTRGPGLQAGGVINAFSAIGWNRDNPSLEDSLAADLYFQFGLIVPSGYTASLSTLDLKLRRAATPSPRDVVVLVSLDGFATEGTEVSSFSYHGRSTGDAPDPDPTQEDPFYFMKFDIARRTAGDAVPTIDLTTIPLLRDIPGGTTVTFRLYSWGERWTVPGHSLALGLNDGPKITGVLNVVK